jgi:hypothetical protein
MSSFATLAEVMPFSKPSENVTPVTVLYAATETSTPGCPDRSAAISAFALPTAVLTSGLTAVFDSEFTAGLAARLGSEPA